MPKSTAKTMNKHDRIKLHIGVDDKKRTEVVEKLASLLATTYMLYLKTLYYHWNVTGSNFVGLHQLFEKQYQELHLAGDEIAERIRALGHFTPGTVREFIDLASIEDDKSLPNSSQQMIQNLLAANEHCSTEAREVLDAAEEAEDEVTHDMMVDRMTYHEKTAWMLRALLE